MAKSAEALHAQDLGGCSCVKQSHRVTRRTHLHLVATPSRQLQLLTIEPTVSNLTQDTIVRGQHFLHRSEANQFRRWERMHRMGKHDDLARASLSSALYLLPVSDDV